eukprot:COSAG01_NODE_78959_length_138_cov_28.333333_1_plen_28_part_10
MRVSIRKQSAHGVCELTCVRASNTDVCR